MRATLVLFTVGLLGIGSSAVAQAPATTPPNFTPQVPSNAYPNPYSAADSLDHVQMRVYRDELAQAKRERRAAERQALAEAAPERLARAEAVANLLNQQKCADAALYALNDGDQAMANRVGQICRKPKDS